MYKTFVAKILNETNNLCHSSLAIYEKFFLIFQIYYELIDKTDKFSVSPNGIITVLKSLDYEKDKKHIVCFVFCSLKCLYFFKELLSTACTN